MAVNSISVDKLSAGVGIFLHRCTWWTENVGYHHVHLYIRPWCVVEHVCKCVYVYLKPQYPHTYCTVMKHQRLPLALQSVLFLWMPCPTSAHSSLWLSCLECGSSHLSDDLQHKHPPCPCYDQVSEFGICLHVPDVCSARFDHRNVSPVGWASWGREERHLAWSLHPFQGWGRKLISP